MNDILKIINSIEIFIKDTKEYYLDGVDEELLDMLQKLKKEVRK